MNPIPLFLDTDIGDDIDDALALTVALNSPEIELRGISTVFRDAPRRVFLARQLLELSGRPEVPVYAGYSKPLLQRYEDIPGRDGVGRQFEIVQTPSEYPTEEVAVEALYRAIMDAHQRGETLTLAPIGPLTNIALLFHKWPEVIPLCRVVLMGGDWGESKAEWNIFCDPEAAAMVFRSGADLTMVGLDVTLRCVLSDEQVEQFRAVGTERATFLADLIERWHHRVTLHDPLTLLALFDDCVRFEDKRIEVALCGEKRAYTQIVEGEPNCRVAVDVDVDRAVSLFLERVLP